MLQEYVEGTGVGVEVLADRGEVLVAFQHERLHETTGYGGTYRKSTSVRPDLLAAAAKLMKALSYTGVAMIEFRVQRDTGAWWLLEINGRFWGSLPLAVASRCAIAWIHSPGTTPSRCCSKSCSWAR